MSAGRVLPEYLGIPEMARRNATIVSGASKEKSPALGHPVEERPPHLLRLLPFSPWNTITILTTFLPETDLLAPVAVEQAGRGRSG